MKTSNWKDYELLDTSSGERLERWGDIILIRPDPQIIWQTEKNHPGWNFPHAKYIRSNEGGGSWKKYKPMPESWEIKYNNISFILKPMGFKHTGLFPEQAVNWDFQIEQIKSFKKNVYNEMKILNLFAYTGGATLASASAGASVCHVDASKGMVEWARENSSGSNLSDKPIRWIIDDCIKFVQREIRRGNKYDGIIMDPPSYGRGPGGEIWKIDEKIFDLVTLCEKLLSDKAQFFILNSYTTGLSPSIMEYLLKICILKNHVGTVTSYEIGLPVTSTKLILPCGSTAIWQFRK